MLLPSTMKRPRGVPELHDASQAVVPGVGNSEIVRSPELTLVLLRIIAADHDAGAAVGAAPAIAQLLVGREAVALAERAELGGDVEAVLAAAGDDVDDAGNGVRAVDRRGARLEHLDPLDHALGDRVEVDRAGHAARRGAVDVAQAVDEDEHAARAEIAQVDLGRAGADAAAVGRVAEIAAIVEPAVERAARARQALQHLGGGGEAGAVDVGAVDEGDRLGLVERVAADARAGDDDGRAALVRGGGGGGGRGAGRLGQSRCRPGGKAGRDGEGGAAETKLCARYWS